MELLRCGQTFVGGAEVVVIWVVVLW